jgi:hypothetical protein
VKAYADHGAVEKAPENAMAGGMKNRQADDYNDSGWRIWPGNYGRFLRMIDPEGSSAAWWHVAPEKSIYSRFARGFDSKAGKKTMRFDLDDGFFAKSKTNACAVRIVYLDRGSGVWNLVYDAAQPKKAKTVKCRNSGAWKELTVDIPDGVFANNLPEKSDIALEYVSGTDTIFHMVEVIRK